MNKELTFEECLKKNEEIGYIEEVYRSVVYARGLPSVHLEEEVILENGIKGEVIGLTSKYVEILLFGDSSMPAGTKIARTGRSFGVNIGNDLLGKEFHGVIIDAGKQSEYVPLEKLSKGIMGRAVVDSAFETGVSLVDLVVPMAVGQRELILGDRKTGKTSFALQAAKSHILRGKKAIICSIGKRSDDVQGIRDFLTTNNLVKNVIHIVTYGSDAAGIIFRAPYVAMTIAEYYAGLGEDVLLILDDMTTHAKYYREITLEAKRFPGRNSYPGDIFFIQSRLLERGGKFTKGSITVLPIAETTAGDLSGYIQTNLMAITDGHLYFDSDLFNGSKIPAINPYLSVTRIGSQAQIPLVRDASRILLRFLIEFQRISQLSHFGAEFDIKTSEKISTGNQLFELFNQPRNLIVPINASLYILALIWSGKWKGSAISKFKLDKETIITSYLSNTKRNIVDSQIQNSKNFNELVINVTSNSII